MITTDQIGVYSQSIIEAAQPRTQEPAVISQHPEEEINVNQQYPIQEITNTEPQVENGIIKDVPIVLSDEHYSSQEEVAGPSFGGSIKIQSTTGAEHMDTEVTESFDAAVSVQEADYMDTEVTEILNCSTKSVEEVTIYEVVTEYRPRPDVGQLLQQYLHIFIQLCDGEIIDAESGERKINIDFIANTELEERPIIDTDPILTDQMSPGVTPH